MGYIILKIASHQRHELSGTSHRILEVYQHLQSRNLALWVPKKTHVSSSAPKWSGCPVPHVVFPTGVPSAHWKCPGVCPMSVAANQKPFRAEIESKFAPWVNFGIKIIFKIIYATVSLFLISISLLFKGGQSIKISSNFSIVYQTPFVAAPCSHSPIHLHSLASAAAFRAADTNHVLQPTWPKIWDKIL